MTIKEFIISRMQLFFLLVTLILTATIILGSIYEPDRELHYNSLVSPLIIAACCVLPTCVTYFRKEPTLRQFVIRQMIELVLIEAIVMLMITPPDDMSKPLFYIVLGAVILAIYAAAMLFFWLQKYVQSKKLTEQLKALQAGE